MTKKYVKEVSHQLLEASDRLNRVIENLLDMSRLNSGMLALKLEWHDVNDLISVTVKKLEKNLAHHVIKTHLPSDLLLLDIDFRLMEHALSNLLLNAAAYSPRGTEIHLWVEKIGEIVKILVEDQGVGIPEASKEKIFEKILSGNEDGWNRSWSFDCEKHRRSSQGTHQCRDKLSEWGWF